MAARRRRRTRLHYTFGLDVVARVGELRYREQQTVEKIATALGQQGVKISLKEIQLLSEVFLALVETVVKNDPQVVEQLRAQGGIVLAADGIQPEKGNETLWLFRDLLELERQVAHKQDDEAQIVRGYCIALCEVLRDEGKYPLEPSGITLYDKLTQIDASLERAISSRASAKLQRLRTLLQSVSTLTKQYARLVIA